MAWKQDYEDCVCMKMATATDSWVECGCEWQV